FGQLREQLCAPGNPLPGAPIQLLSLRRRRFDVHRHNRFAAEARLKPDTTSEPRTQNPEPRTENPRTENPRTRTQNPRTQNPERRTPNAERRTPNALWHPRPPHAPHRPQPITGVRAPRPVRRFGLDRHFLAAALGGDAVM